MARTIMTTDQKARKAKARRLFDAFDAERIALGKDAGFPQYFRPLYDKYGVLQFDQWHGEWEGYAHIRVIDQTGAYAVVFSRSGGRFQPARRIIYQGQFKMELNGWMVWGRGISAEILERLKSHCSECGAVVCIYPYEADCRLHDYRHLCDACQQAVNEEEFGAGR